MPPGLSSLPIEILEQTLIYIGRNDLSGLAALGGTCHYLNHIIYHGEQRIWRILHHTLYDDPTKAGAYLHPRIIKDWRRRVIDRHWARLKLLPVTPAGDYDLEAEKDGVDSSDTSSEVGDVADVDGTLGGDSGDSGEEGEHEEGVDPDTTLVASPERKGLDPIVRADTAFTLEPQAVTRLTNIIIDMFLDIPPCNVSPDELDTFESINSSLVESLIRSYRFRFLALQHAFHDGFARLRLLISHEVQAHRTLTRTYGLAGDSDEVYADPDPFNADGTVCWSSLERIVWTYDGEKNPFISVSTEPSNGVADVLGPGLLTRPPAPNPSEEPETSTTTEPQGAETPTSEGGPGTPSPAAIAKPLQRVWDWGGVAGEWSLHLVNDVLCAAITMQFNPVLDLANNLLGKRLTRSEMAKPANWVFGLEGDLAVSNDLPPVNFEMTQFHSAIGFTAWTPLKGVGMLRLTPDNPPQLRWTLRLTAGTRGQDGYTRLHCEGVQIGGRDSGMGVQGTALVEQNDEVSKWQFRFYRMRHGDDDD